jgi:hypothetical protein
MVSPIAYEVKFIHTSKKITRQDKVIIFIFLSFPQGSVFTVVFGRNELNLGKISYI